MNKILEEAIDTIWSLLFILFIPFLLVIGASILQNTFQFLVILSIGLGILFCILIFLNIISAIYEKILSKNNYIYINQTPITPSKGVWVEREVPVYECSAKYGHDSYCYLDCKNNEYCNFYFSKEIVYEEPEKFEEV